LFDVDQLDPAAAVEFYQHDMAWSNRMILGDSLVVMASLLDRERLAGQVQCVFMDPPYGIRYGSNFQPNISDRAVRDGDDASLTREPEMIQAYRDTWELGVHSYLSYLRDRLAAARDLLTDSGSVFVQIGEENVHRVRILLDEVLGAENFVSQITFTTTSGAGSPSELKNLPAICNYIVWYAKDRDQMKYRQLYVGKRGVGEDANYSWIEMSDGSRRKMMPSEFADPNTLPDGARPYRLGPLTSQAVRENSGRFTVDLDGATYAPGKGVWKTSPEGMARLKQAQRLQASGKTLSYVRFLDDFAARPLVNMWTDTVQSGFGAEKRYVVQTNPTVIERCILMTTDPGDLVLDPTCGSGSTAYVAEKYGRRWITVDTSRVALAIARERVLTARYEMYELFDTQRGVDAGFKYKTLDRVTLRSIARAESAETVPLYDQPLVAKGRVRVSGPFTVEALSRYAVNPSDREVSAPDPAADTGDHVRVLLDALSVQGIPRSGGKPYAIESLAPIAAAGPIQAEGVADLGARKARFAVSLGPKFGAVTMGQVSDALRASIGFDLIVFGGFAVSAEAQERLATGKVGGSDVALLLANPDLLVGDLLKNTKASQTFRLYASPDVRIEHGNDGYRVLVEGVDSFDAATGDVTSLGRAGVQAWFLDDDYDGAVFRVSQAFFPVSDAWDKLQNALRGTVDAELIEALHGWDSLPFDRGDHGRIAVRVVAQDGNAAEIVLDLPEGAT
jgi:adenine-specific DNA-methyltransferase